MINGVSMKLRLVRSKDAFALMAGGELPDYRINIKEAILYIRKVKISSVVQLAHIEALEKTSAKYPITRVDTKLFSVPRGNMTANVENLFSGQLPKRIVVGCVVESFLF